MRRAFAVMTEDYRRLPRSERLKSCGFEAVAMMCADMDRGVLEADAYRRLGQSCDLPLYRSLSVLLVQNLKRGSRELIDMLEREAVSAFEERKKEARILGDRTMERILAVTDIPTGHKIALGDIAPGEAIIKYGVVIGQATAAIPRGSWVHLHVMHSLYDERSSHLDAVTGAPKDTKYE